MFTAVVVSRHICPSFYDATLREPGLHELEHLLYLVAGLLLWSPLLDGDPAPAHRLGGLGQLVYLIAAMVPMALLGAYLNRHASLVYPAYGMPARALGISALDDQAKAGQSCGRGKHDHGRRRTVGSDRDDGLRGAPAASARSPNEARRSRHERRQERGAMRRWLARPSRLPRGPRIVLAVTSPRSRSSGSRRRTRRDSTGSTTLAGGTPTPGANAPAKSPLPPGPGNPTKTFPSSPALAAEGYNLYQEGCASCHGLALHGTRGVAPSLIGVGPGPVDFYLSTGRMPLDNPRAEPSETAALHALAD